MSSDPCAACSWTTERQNHCNYNSNLKLFYEAGDRGVWSLDSRLILQDRGASLPTFEVPNIQFVREQTSIPVPAVVESWAGRQIHPHINAMHPWRTPQRSLAKAFHG
ncbi:hypothetical protein BDW75DRAFT_226411 [Aspergillus navahoensis]